MGERFIAHHLEARNAADPDVEDASCPEPDAVLVVEATIAMRGPSPLDHIVRRW
jgi:hypothetical protein